jgi:polar amino acid transport system substrate-binding protein
MNRNLARGTLVAALLLLTPVAVFAAPLAVCIDKASAGAAVDRRVAEAVARQQGTTLAVHEFDGDSDDDDGFDMKNFATMASTQCQLVMGFPRDQTHGEVPAGLQATAGYGRTGFVLVTPQKLKATSLKTLPKGSEVAVTYQTTPNLYFADHPGISADVHLTDKDALDALTHRKVGAAMLWRPTVVRYLAAHHANGAYRYVELDEPHAHWDLVALYGAPNKAAAVAFEASVQALRASGQLAILLGDYAVADAAARPAAVRWQPGRAATLANACAAKAKAAGAPPALFTSAQADTGKAKFADNCAQCHGDNLEGRAGPALKGTLFASPSANFHVSDIFTIVSQNMPATNPGSLARDDYVEIMAYILQQNGYPAGSTALTFDLAAKSKTALLYHGQ